MRVVTVTSRLTQSIWRCACGSAWALCVGRWRVLTIVLVLTVTPAWADHNEDESWEQQQRWQEMSEQERAEIRAGQRRFQRLSPEEKQKLRRAQQHYQNLPEQEQRELRERWQDSSRKKENRKNKN